MKITSLYFSDQLASGFSVVDREQHATASARTCSVKESSQIEQLKQMLQEWWGAGVDNSAQKVLHMDDLLMMADPACAQNRTIKWMILGEEV